MTGRGEAMGGGAEDVPAIRLLLSGGGYRAMLGSVGVLLHLVTTGDWGRVKEVVSVSGGSPVNAALVSIPADAPGAVDADTQRIRGFYERLIGDRGSPWASPRRMAIVVWLVVALAVIVAVVLAAGGLLPGTGSSRPWVAIGLTFVAFPAMLQAGRTATGWYFHDIMNAVTDGRSSQWADLHDSGASRQHVVCCTGLSSAAPYYFWIGGQRLLPPDDEAGSRRRGDPSEKERWGIDVDPIRYRSHTVGEVALASSSLPLVGSVMSPLLDSSDRQDGVVGRRERLVDGGGSGLFGAQVADPGRLRVEPVTRSSGRGATTDVIAVDSFRHESAQPGAMGAALDFVRSRLSSLWYLIDYVKVASEALYVNDLADSDTATLIRLCSDDMAPAPNDAEPNSEWKSAWAAVVARNQKADQLHAKNPAGMSVTDRLTRLRDDTAKVGLLFLNEDKGVTAVTTGVVATHLARSESYNAAELDAILLRCGELLYPNDATESRRLHDRWHHTLTEPEVRLPFFQRLFQRLFMRKAAA